VAVSRNQACPCGSGKRHKHCCGATAGPAGAGASTGTGPFGAHTDAMHAALSHLAAGRYELADALFRGVLAQAPELPDALHMLAVACLHQGQPLEASSLVRRAGELTGWTLPGIHRNFRLALGARLAQGSAGRLARRRLQYREWLAQRAGPQRRPAPLVSAIVPVYNHADFIAIALDSIYGQTYPNIEIVVIDDGSTDGSPEIVREKLRTCPFPHTFLCRENRGAPATLNEAVRSSSGSYFNPLNSDDLWVPTRIEELVATVAAGGFEWGYSSVSFIDARGRPLAEDDDPLVQKFLDWADDRSPLDAAGPSLLDFNGTVTTGNLFCARRLFDLVGGFRDFRYNHDWDFCLGALWQAEPLRVPAALYRYRIHSTNTIRESSERAGAEAEIVKDEYHTKALRERPVNPFAPSRASLGPDYIAKQLAEGGESAFTSLKLIAIADELDTLDRTAAEAAVPTAAWAPSSRGTDGRIFVCTGILQLATALAAAESAGGVRDDHLVILNGQVNADPKLRNQAADLLAATAGSLHGFKTITQVDAPTQARWSDSCAAHGARSVLAEVRGRIGVDSAQEIYLPHNSSFGYQVLMNAYAAARRVSFGDGIGYRYPMRYYEQYMLAPRGAAALQRAADGAPGGAADNAPAGPGLPWLEFDQQFVLIPDVYGEDDPATTRLVSPAILRRHIERLGTLIEGSCIARLRHSVGTRPVILLLTSMLAEQQKISVEHEVAAYLDFLETIGAASDTHVLVKPHPRSGAAKNRRLEVALGRRYAAVTLLSDPVLHAFPVESFYSRLAADVFGDRQGADLMIATVSTTCLSLARLFGVATHVGFGEKVVSRWFPPEQQSARVEHEHRLARVLAGLAHPIPDAGRFER